ncbi:hypothetical protein RN001_000706 [Aquatica leii]|uniref:cystathionine beta-synthase n=1 Tax=Aquatica leii TaxID=1421715 RepID=A0AAN7Q9V1_9COLE|nr:hypothetical protein RN001_000706 [Aquatica leii]
MEANKPIYYLQPDVPAKCLFAKDNLTNNPHPVLVRNIEQKIYPDISHCIGNTPLVKLNHIPKSMGIKCDVLVKCEFLNPGGSIKDRMAHYMIQNAENKGLLKPGSILIEPTSGNTGIALGMISAIKGYECILVFPGKSSNEKEDILKALGCKVVRCSDKIPYNQPGGIFCRPMEIHKETPNSAILHQFWNPCNPLSHYYGTAMEIFEQCDGKVDMVAIGVGTGGTATGIGRRFKEMMPECLIVGVDPIGSAIAEPASINETDVIYFEIEGIGHGFHPPTLDKKMIDFWLKVGDKESLNMARRMHKEEGILCGGSSGTILCGALEAAKSLKEGQKCVVILPDGVGNYLTKFLSDYWMEVRGFIPCTNTFNHWWWDYKVALLKPIVGLAISNTKTCQEALDFMNERGHNILPVVNSDNNLEGVVTIKDITKALLNSSVKTTDSVEKVLSDKYITVTPTSTLGLLSRVLDNEGIAIVIEEKDNKLNQQVPKLIGVIFATDFLQYISENRP